MNIFLRLGWIRFVLFKAMRATCGLSMASRLFGVSSWVKLHDEVKVHAGYFRFIIIVALVTARAIAYGFLPFNHPQTPGFGLSASCAICGLLLTEILEDWTVLQQVLPESPVTVEMLLVPHWDVIQKNILAHLFECYRNKAKGLHPNPKAMNSKPLNPETLNTKSPRA